MIHYTGYTVIHYTGHTLYRVYTIQGIHYTGYTLYRVYTIWYTLYRVSNDESIVFCGSHVFYSSFFQINIFNLDVLYIYYLELLYSSYATNSQIIFLDHLIEEN